MTLSEYIKGLQKLEKTGLGNIPLMHHSCGDIRGLNNLPLPTYLKIRTPRESKTKVWQPCNGEELKGDLVLIQ